MKKNQKIYAIINTANNNRILNLLTFSSSMSSATVLTLVKKAYGNNIDIKDISNTGYCYVEIDDELVKIISAADKKLRVFRIGEKYSETSWKESTPE